MSDGPRSVTVAGHDETVARLDDVNRWSEVARATLTGEGVASGHLDLFFVDPPAMADLNRQHMGADRPTDVLAFPLDGPGTQDDSPDLDAEVPPVHLGDVVVCPAVARDQASDNGAPESDEQCSPFEAELTLLIVHGVLHVLGHDHAEPAEAVVMQDRERLHLARYGCRHPVPAP